VTGRLAGRAEASLRRGCVGWLHFGCVLRKETWRSVDAMRRWGWQEVVIGVGEGEGLG